MYNEFNFSIRLAKRFLQISDVSGVGEGLTDVSGGMEGLRVGHTKSALFLS